MIELNLLPEDRRRKETVKFVMPDIPIKSTLIWIFGVFCGIQALAALAALFFAFQMGSIRKETAQLRVEYKDVLARKEEVAGMKTRLKEMRLMSATPFKWTRLMNSLSDSATKGIWVRSLTLADGEQAPRESKGKRAAGIRKVKILRLEGSVVAPGQETAFIGKFIQQLKEDPYLSTLFDSIDLSTINQRKIREYDVYDFTLNCAFKSEILGSSS